MGQLIDGKWDSSWYDTKSSGGAFRRSTAGFRNWITPDGAPPTEPLTVRVACAGAAAVSAATTAAARARRVLVSMTYLNLLECTRDVAHQSQCSLRAIGVIA